MNLFNLNNDQILKILTGQDPNPTMALMNKLTIACGILFAMFIFVIFISTVDDNDKNNKRLRIAGGIIGIIDFILAISVITIGINYATYINKYKDETRTWMTEEITAIVDKNPLVFTNLAITEIPFDFDTFTYDDNNLTTTIDLMVGSINIKADIDTHDVTIEPNNIDAAIIVKIQEALNNNDIKLNPKSIELDKTNNQIKALVSDANEIVTINYSNDINDTIINIESTGSKPITITLD